MSYALLRRECVLRTSSYIYAIHVHVLVFFLKVYKNSYLGVNLFYEYPDPQTRKSAIWLAGKMSKEGHAVALITGESTIEQRIAVLDR